VTFVKFLKNQFWRWDTGTFRLLFALSSLAFAAALLAERASFDTSRGFLLMRAVARVEVWSFGFALHWGLLTVCVLPTFRYWRRLNTCVNLFGFALWGSYVLMQWMSLGHFTVGSSMESVALCFAALTVLRHGFVSRASDIV
jgi:hypothetical protein